MFEIRTYSPLDEMWEDRDQMLYNAAGRHSDGSGAGSNHVRDHVWILQTFDEAALMKQRLEAIDGVQVSLRER